MKTAGIAIAVALVVVCLVTGVLTASGRLWWKYNKYKVVVNGSSANATAYSGGSVLLVDTGRHRGDSYVIYPNRHELGVAEPQRFIRFPGCVLSLDKPATYIPIGKSEVPVKVQFQDNQVAFDGTHGEAIKVSW
jgi:hypothetical protein